MIFTHAPIPGAFILDIEPNRDNRGFFARTVCQQQFIENGANANFVQQSISHNIKCGIIRGLHWQATPYEEEKLVRVTTGAIFDVIVDLRLDSHMYGQWYSVLLSSDNHRSIYIPKGVAHGFQTLSAQTEILYEMTTQYRPEFTKGLRWDDPSLHITWPDPGGAILSKSDLALPLLRDYDPR